MIWPVLLVALLGLAACQAQESAPSTRVDAFDAYQKAHAATKRCELTRGQRSLIRNLFGAVEFEPVGTEMFVEVSSRELASRLAGKGFETRPLEHDPFIIVFSHCGGSSSGMNLSGWVPFRAYNTLFGAKLISQRNVGDVRIQNFHQLETGANIYVLVGDGVAFLLGGPQPAGSLDDLAAVLTVVVRA